MLNLWVISCCKFLVPSYDLSTLNPEFELSLPEFFTIGSLETVFNLKVGSGGGGSGAYI